MAVKRGAQILLIVKALRHYGEIFLCGPDRKLEDCFTEERGKKIFWFSTRDKSTHIVVSDE